MISDGILVLNKPQNWTSHDCVAICRRVLRLKGVKKIGHGGSEIPGRDGSVCMVDWVDVPHFYRYGSDIVQYIGSDEMILSVLEQICSETIVG